MKPRSTLTKVFRVSCCCQYASKILHKNAASVLEEQQHRQLTSTSTISILRFVSGQRSAPRSSPLFILGGEMGQGVLPPCLPIASIGFLSSLLPQAQTRQVDKVTQREVLPDVVVPLLLGRGQEGHWKASRQPASRTQNSGLGRFFQTLIRGGNA